jgi:hypothetical protein
MAGPINTPVTADIGHLSVEDLFAPLPEKMRLGGPGPFVINLAVSSAPIDLPAKSFDAGRDAYVYQVQRSEDRRLRYRLRLGTFANEDDADAVLEKVRNIYPAALTATADADDLRSIAALQSKTGAQRARAAAKAAGVAAAMKAATPAAPMTMAAGPMTKAPEPVTKAAEPAPMVLSLVEEPVAPKAAAPVTTTAELAPMVLSLIEEPVAPPKAAAPPSLVLSLLDEPPATPPVLLDRVVAPGVVTPGVAAQRIATGRRSASPRRHAAHRHAGAGRCSDATPEAGTGYEGRAGNEGRAGSQGCIRNEGCAGYQAGGTCEADAPGTKTQCHS